MSTTSRFSRRDFLKAAAPAAIAVTQGVAPAQTADPQGDQPKYMPAFFSDAEWKFVNAATWRRPTAKYGSFVLGTGVGGAGVHWNGQLWRASPEDLRLRSHIEHPFIGAGAAGMMAIDEFNSDHFDHSAHGFIGGSTIYAGGTGGRPIAQTLMPPNAG